MNKIIKFIIILQFLIHAQGLFYLLSDAKTLGIIIEFLCAHSGSKVSCGIPQGCPLSLYLLLICAQGLSSLLSDVKTSRIIIGFSCSHNGPKVSNLFFNDDSLLFTRATLEDIYSLKDLLGWYKVALG